MGLGFGLEVGVRVPVVQREELGEQLDALQPVALISARDDALQLRQQVGDLLRVRVRVRVRLRVRVRGLG